MFHSYLERATSIVTTVTCMALAGIAFAQGQPTTPAKPMSPSTSSAGTTQMPAVTPSKSETAISAFEKLDSSHAGYVDKAQVAKLDGFDNAFTQADKNNDGKLSQDEFRVAWAIYTGTQG